MKVRDIMTRDVVSCQKETDIGTAARLMLHGRFGTLPVVDAHGRLAGIITDRDIAMAAATRRRNASHIAVHEAMSQSVRSCFAEDDLPAALKQMEEGRARRLPVLDAAGRTGRIAFAERDDFPAFEAEFPASSGDEQAPISTADRGPVLAGGFTSGVRGDRRFPCRRRRSRCPRRQASGALHSP